MRGVRGWALLAGVAMTAVAVWQVVLYTGAPSPSSSDGTALTMWLQYITDTPMLGKTWGARVTALLLALVPLRVFSERARSGWGSASRAFLYVWLPLVFVGLLLQTQPIERLRDLIGEGDSDVVALTVTMWHAVVEPLMRTSAVIGVLSFSMLLASVGGRSPIIGVVMLLVLVVLIVVLWSPMMEAIVSLVQGLVLVVLAFATPGEPAHATMRRI